MRNSEYIKLYVIKLRLRRRKHFAKIKHMFDWLVIACLFASIELMPNGLKTNALPQLVAFVDMRLGLFSKPINHLRYSAINMSPNLNWNSQTVWNHIFTFVEFLISNGSQFERERLSALLSIEVDFENHNFNFSSRFMFRFTMNYLDSVDWKGFVDMILQTAQYTQWTLLQIDSIEYLDWC